MTKALLRVVGPSISQQSLRGHVLNSYALARSVSNRVFGDIEKEAIADVVMAIQN